MNKRLRRNISLKDIAEKAGVSSSVVSRILTNSLDLRAKKDTIARVKRIASELNYRPHSSARSLRTGKTFVLNMYIPSVANPVFPEIIRGSEEACRKHGYSLFISHLDKHAVSERRYLDSLIEGRIDGLLMASTLVKNSAIDDLIQQGGNFILINRCTNSNANYIAIDDVEGSRMAVNHLVELGHKHIAFISGPLMLDTALRRFQGYRQGLHEHGLEYNNNFVQETDWFSYNGGRESMDKLLARTRKPTAVFISNLMSCVGAISAIHNAGLRIPEDISVVGYHDAPLAEVLIPPLTVVKLPLYEMGYKGTDDLINMLNGKEIKGPILLPPTGIIKRKSAAPIR